MSEFTKEDVLYVLQNRRREGYGGELTPAEEAHYARGRREQEEAIAWRWVMMVVSIGGLARG